MEQRDVANAATATNNQGMVEVYWHAASCVGAIPHVYDGSYEAESVSECSSGESLAAK